MQVFVPYPSPIDVAKCLDNRRLRKQIIECDQILAAINGESKGWLHHPIAKMYQEHRIWLDLYRRCLVAYSRGQIDEALVHNADAFDYEPPFLTGELCDQHKRRLYTKAPDLYPQFAPYGKSEENWYVVDGELVKYANGKRV